jgi:hypothetical protein
MRMNLGLRLPFYHEKPRFAIGFTVVADQSDFVLVDGDDAGELQDGGGAAGSAVAVVIGFGNM